jgi:hypothetical protein
MEDVLRWQKKEFLGVSAKFMLSFAFLPYSAPTVRLSVHPNRRQLLVAPFHERGLYGKHCPQPIAANLEYSGDRFSAVR